MRFTLLVLAAVVAGTVPAAAEDHRAETDHFVFMWEDDAVTEDGLQIAKGKGEAFYAAIHDLLGYEPKAKVIVLLNGPAERQDGSWGYPRVDQFARIHLFRFTDSDDSYFNALAHELVHVFRFQRKPHHDWFLEEGFAEFVARRVDSSLDGFPWYGFEVALVAGQWVGTDKEIPLSTLRERHQELNIPCKLQSYSLRASFFLFLGDTFGNEKVIELANEDEAGALDAYPRIVGKDFEELEKAWREALLETYNAIEGVEAMTREYRRSPAQYSPVCTKGEDF